LTKNAEVSKKSADFAKNIYIFRNYCICIKGYFHVKFHVKHSQIDFRLDRFKTHKKSAEKTTKKSVFTKNQPFPLSPNMFFFNLPCFHWVIIFNCH